MKIFPTNFRKLFCEGLLSRLYTQNIDGLDHSLLSVIFTRVYPKRGKKQWKKFKSWKSDSEFEIHERRLRKLAKWASNGYSERENDWSSSTLASVDFGSLFWWFRFQVRLSSNKSRPAHRWTSYERQFNRISQHESNFGIHKIECISLVYPIGSEQTVLSKRV